MTRSINSEAFGIFVSQERYSIFKMENKAQIIDFFFFLAKAFKKIFVLCLGIIEYK